jgi:CelD/BcsL family acetyltransferase involved in cellulose biosynthesis
MTYQLRVLRSTNDLRDAAAKWDRLWRASDSTMPIAQSELLLQWIERFAPRGRLEFYVAEQGDRFVAALPLVASDKSPWIAYGTLPGNEWSPAGDFLLDPTADAELAAQTIAKGILGSGFALVWMQGIPYLASRWSLLLEALEQQGVPSHRQFSYNVGLVPTCSDWDSFNDKISKKRLRTLARRWRQLTEMGTLRLRIETNLAPDEVGHDLFEGIEIEDRGWKGREGTSVLKSPGMMEYYYRQAKLLAKAGNLIMVTLELDRRPIAFEYGFLAKGHYHSLKIGYDEAFANYSPGQVRTWLMLEEMCRRPELQYLDGMGPRSEAFAVWPGTTYEVGRIVFAPGGALGRTALYGYKNVWPALRKFSGRQPVPAATEPTEETADA